jgi:hypothetical protein
MVPTNLLSLDVRKNSSTAIWHRRGNAIHTSINFTAKSSADLDRSLKEAQRIKQDRIGNAARKKIIKNIHKRAIVIVDKLEDTYLDSNDVTGLIGEMMLEDMSSFHNQISICPKWRKTGSSKSKGLDLICSNDLGSLQRVVVKESKHLHDEISNSASQNYVVIKSKCVEAIEQSDVNHVLCSLTDVITRFGDNLTFLAATHQDTTTTKKSYDLLENALRECNFELWIAVFVDDKYCTSSDFSNCMNNLDEPSAEYGNFLSVEIIVTNMLEDATKDLCIKFVQ